MKIYVSGSVAYDRIMNFPGYFKDNILPDKIHILNVSFFIDRLEESFGGTAGNIAYNLALLGERPTVLANVGADFTSFQKWFEKNQIDQSQIFKNQNQVTASAYIITDRADNQISGFYPGAGKLPYQLNQKILSKNSLAILAPDNPRNFSNLIKIYKHRQIPYIFDPGQQTATLSGLELRLLITGAKIFIANDYEQSLAQKKTGWTFAQFKNIVEILVTTLGAKGSILYSKNKTFRIKPARPKNTLDPTGAGDAYRAGLIKGLVLGYDLKTCGQLASTVAVYTVEKYGTQTHTFTWAGLKKRYAQNYKVYLS